MIYILTIHWYGIVWIAGFFLIPASQIIFENDRI
jgi:hypothetical protein